MFVEEAQDDDEGDDSLAAQLHAAKFNAIQPDRDSVGCDSLHFNIRLCTFIQHVHSSDAKLCCEKPWILVCSVVVVYMNHHYSR
jgi:hypothetical protein